MAQHHQASRRRIIRYTWAVLAVAALAILLVWGSGSGGDGTTGDTVGGVLGAAVTASGTGG